ncbi:MAG: PQQ-binding-like beta-propeller repeat protein [Methanobacteriaceae archaeon]|nr:PQQ-binding-like beta-propeller repeat protein [Methanobacteriaceae archaeon]MDP2836975.1 PQQ-binding-like beta-propeller repeat protein [Methanobacteriaceae archaeon]MDP3034853.1 PQQ-binding-like beta-propeller repeat protein [Methanobacteriaceae archaeon]MDP3485280.1 PQQ-binding-like beta-propeller repeat protein [Methanobacteriaceae archaeon]MDP3624783.1 PQQ-binding-like beta-propeller repeat protein [Methanobacteriaceae archaeon]
MIKKEHKLKQITLLMALIALIFISISPVMADSVDALADSQYPKAMNDNQNSGQSQYVGPQNNSTQWNYTTGDQNSQINHAPSIGPDGTIYLPTRFKNGTNYLANLYALNPDGTKKWNYTILDGILNENCYNSFEGSPAITADGTIYITGAFHDNTRTYGMVYAFNPDGTVKWKYILNEGSTVYMSGPPAVGTDGTIYFSSSYYEGGWNAKLNALAPNGAKKWEYDVSQGQYGNNVPSPAIALDGTIYFVYHNSSYSGSIVNLCALDQNGGIKWVYQFNGGVRSHPAVASDGTIYLTGDNGKLYAINPDGTLKWQYTAQKGDYTGLMTAPSVSKDGTIYVGGYFKENDGYPGILYAINPDGTLKWSFTTVRQVGINPVIGADGTIYFGDGGGDDTFYALNPDGTIKWSLAVNPSTSAALSSDGTLYFGVFTDGSNYLYAIQGPGSNPGNDTNNTNNTPVNASTTTSYDTVGMQNTGMPLTGVILAFLMVVSGFIYTHKKE